MLPFQFMLKIDGALSTWTCQSHHCTYAKDTNMQICVQKVYTHMCKTCSRRSLFLEVPWREYCIQEVVLMALVALSWGIFTVIEAVSYTHTHGCPMQGTVAGLLWGNCLWIQTVFVAQEQSCLTDLFVHRLPTWPVTGSVGDIWGTSSCSSDWPRLDGRHKPRWPWWNRQSGVSAHTEAGKLYGETLTTIFLTLQSMLRFIRRPQTLHVQTENLNKLVRWQENRCASVCT